MEYIIYTVYDADDNEIEKKVPGKYEVCDRCRGEGTHVNPNIDGHGITQEEWETDWDEEEKETYRSGGYNIICLSCEGKRVELVPDWDNMPQNMATEYEKHLEQQSEWDRERRSEEKFGY